MTCSGCSGAVERVLGKLQGKKFETFHFFIISICRNILNISGQNLVQFPCYLILFFLKLSLLLGVQNVKISLEDQLVQVTGTASRNDILTAIKKTGKPVETI